MKWCRIGNGFPNFLLKEDSYVPRHIVRHLGLGLPDADRLFRYCLARADHRDFFIRKAIGWALRAYAWTDPKEVARYVYAHESELSGLSRREALKNIR